MKIVKKENKEVIAVIDENEVLLLNTKEYKIINDKGNEKDVKD